MSECLGFPHFGSEAPCSSLGRRNDRHDKLRMKFREDISIRIKWGEEGRIKAVASLWLEEFDLTQVEVSPGFFLYHQPLCIALMFNIAIITIL
jgi:hypothetical protein